jgi:hypothetical protein
VNQDEIMNAIIEALRQLPAPKWTKHKDFSDRAPTWWVDDMHLEWLAEEYLYFIADDRKPLTASERKRVLDIGKQAAALSDLMRRSRSHRLGDHFADERSPASQTQWRTWARSPMKRSRNRERRP